MDDRTFLMLTERLDRIELKVDKLMGFRSYILGIAAVCGLIGSYIHSIFKGY